MDDDWIKAQSSPFYIVGIGASAGGLEAFRELLEHLPPKTGMAFVLIQHLSPHHESLLSQILKRETSMPVVEVKNGMRVQPNHVYVITPNVSMTIQNGVLKTEERDPADRLPRPIDAFFRSLAIDQKERAIGVTLSGTGADGAEGTKVIKEEGGITFAQAPETAQFAAMPSATILIDHVDFVLSPLEIAAELAKFNTVTTSLPWDDEKYHRILEFIQNRGGTDFRQYKQSTIQRRIARRRSLNKSADLAAYLQLLETNPEEAKALLEDILIHVTEFFREPEGLELLKKEVFPTIAKNRGNPGIRIWVPGCSTGEEAYSIAICLKEYLEENGILVKVQIFATDLSEKCIAAARQGVYSSAISERVSAERLSKFFRKTEDGYRISKTIRDLCVFAQHDLTRDAPYSKLDLISCRNMLIYFGHPLQNKTIETFWYSLNLGGFLLLGQSENVGIAVNYFSPIDPKKKVYSKRPMSSEAPFASKLSMPELKLRQQKLASPESPLSALQVQSEIDRTILARFTPPSVVVNDDYQVLQFRGRTEFFMPSNTTLANANLLKIVRSELVDEVTNTIQECIQKETAVRSPGVAVEGKSPVVIEVSPLNLQGSRCFLISFDSLGAVVNRKLKTDLDGARSSSEVESQLQDELIATKIRLNAVINDLEKVNQDLQSANEEIISSNEELQSTNEELETSKEELQSTNEELNTVNDELQARNQELFVLNSDLTNLLNSFYIPIIIVTSDLIIRRFTPTSSKFLNLKSGDVGRPITDITSNLIDITDLTRTIQEVIDTATVQEKEIRDNRGHWHQLRVRPYKTLDQKLDGAVITLFDLKHLKTQMPQEED